MFSTIITGKIGGFFFYMWQCAPLLVTIKFCVLALLYAQSESKRVPISSAPVTSGFFPLTSAGFPVRSPPQGEGWRWGGLHPDRPFLETVQDSFI